MTSEEEPDRGWQDEGDKPHEFLIRRASTVEARGLSTPELEVPTASFGVERLVAVSTTVDPVLLGYVDVKCSGGRSVITDLQSRGRLLGFVGVGARLLAGALEHVVEEHGSIVSVEARAPFSRNDPTWLLAAQTRVFFSAGFEMRYSVWDTPVRLVCHYRRTLVNAHSG